MAGFAVSAVQLSHAANEGRVLGRVSLMRVAR